MKLERRLAYIEWVDSFGNAGWQPNTYKPMPRNELICKSFGFVFDEDEHSIVITTSLSFFDAPIDPLQIPKVAICEFREIPIEDLENA